MHGLCANYSQYFTHSEIETVFGAGDETCNDMIPPFVNNDTCRYTCITYFITGCQ